MHGVLFACAIPLRARMKKEGEDEESEEGEEDIGEV